MTEGSKSSVFIRAELFTGIYEEIEAVNRLRIYSRMAFVFPWLSKGTNYFHS